MRVENNSSGGNGVQHVAEKAQEEKNIKKENTKKAENKSLYAGELNLCEDEIVRKKKQAQAMAMQMISDAFESDNKIDEDLDERREHVQKLNEENAEHNEILKDIAKEKENIKELYGEDTKEYKEQLAMLRENEKEYRKKIEDNTKMIYEENAIIRGVKIRRLEQHDMVDAVKQGEVVKEAASKEIIGMLAQSVVDKIDEQTEELEKEKEEIREEKIKENKETEKDREEELYELIEDMDKVETQQSSEDMKDIKKSLNQIIGELKLTAEDLKGAVVDTEL